LGFLAGDLAHLLLPWLELKEMAKMRGIPPSHTIKDKNAAIAAIGVLFLWMLSIVIP